MFRSLARLARRALVAGVAAAIALTLFDAVQPTLGRRPSSGTVEDVPLTLAPEPPGPVALAAAVRPAGEGRVARRRPPAPPVVVSQPVAVGRARMVGLSWPDPTPGGPAAAPGAAAEEEAGVWTRVRTAGGWSPWLEAEVSAEAPDANSPEYDPDRVYTDGRWLEADAREVQVRVDPEGGPDAPAVPAAGAAGDPVAAHLVTPDMTPTPGTEVGGPNQAVAATSQPPIISRARWRADERLRRAGPSYSRGVKAAFIHHTVQANRYAASESAALVRADYVYHTRTRGWNDVGYNFLVDRFGRIFEGRYGGVTRAVLGAHAGGFNTDTTGVALLGTFSSVRPPAAMVAAVQRLLAWKLDLSHVDPRGRTTLTSRGGANVRHPAGRRVAVPVVLGHRATSFTDCPGALVMSLLPSIRAAAARIGLPKIFGGAAGAAHVTPGSGSSSVAVRARFSGTVGWTATATASNGVPVRRWSGRGATMAVSWNGRSRAGAAAPGGWATITVTARAGRVSARPVSSSVYVRRATSLGGTTTGGFSRGTWTLSDRNVDQEQPRGFTRAAFGRHGDVPLVGDWDGDGDQELGVVRGNVFHLRGGVTPGSPVVQRFGFGRRGDKFVVGDWDGDGDWTPGVVRDGLWLLRDSNSSGPASVPGFRFGRRGDRFVVGDWDGERSFTPGLFRGGVWHLRDGNGPGPDRTPFRFGRAGDQPFAGDWDGDGSMTPGVLRSGRHWYLRNALGGGGAALGLRKQTAGIPVVGDFDGAP